MPRKSAARSKPSASTPPAYAGLVTGIAQLLESARRVSARAVNAVMTATYWEVGRRIVYFEQGGKSRAEYGEHVLERLAVDLTTRFGRGFSLRNLRNFRMSYLPWPIRQTLSAESSQTKSSTPSGISLDQNSQTASGLSVAKPIPQTLSAEFDLSAPAGRFPLPWSHYVRLLSVDNPQARSFYEAEALRGSWSVRQLDRQVSTRFYERTALSRDKAAMLTKGGRPKGDPAGIARPGRHMKPTIEQLSGFAWR